MRLMLLIVGPGVELTPVAEAFKQSPLMDDRLKLLKEVFTYWTDDIDSVDLVEVTDDQ